MSANCDPMIYPLLFPHGDLGWHCELQHDESHATAKRNKVPSTEAENYSSSTWLMLMLKLKANG